MTLGEVTIPLQVREREFSIHYEESFSWQGLFIAIDPVTGLAEDCGTKTGDGSATISENAVFTDSELVYVDHINGIAIWREFKETCIFSYEAEKVAVFKVTWGSFYSHWFEVTPLVQQEEKWFMLVNGVKTEVDSWTNDYSLPTLNILWPLPPGKASPGDPCPESFYDYNSDDELARSDGGKDFYYPSWLRGMGLNRDIDKEEAEERYNTYFFHDPRPPSEPFYLPRLGYVAPGGNAAIDEAGNVCVSFATRNGTVNKIIKPDNTVVDIVSPEGMTGANFKFYPVGLI